MATNLDQLARIIEVNDITIADLEFIINYLNSENISPQLAMRRIKSFEQLKQKLENPEDKNRIFELNNELTQIREELQKKEEELNNLQSEKSGLESEKKELETKSELLDSERDELQRQLQMLQEIQFEEPEKEDRDLETRLEEFVDMLAKTIDTHEEASTFLLPIKLHLGKILEDPNSIDFESEAFAKTIGEIIDQLKQSTADREEIKPQTSAKPTKTVATEQKSQQKEKTAEQPPTMKSQPVSDPEPEDEKSEKIDPRKQKENQVLNLFIEFIEEADNDPNFKERVATICEMDEAYEYLGSIGLSQVYSFSSRGVDKKDDLLKLLKSWKRDGVPR